MNRFGLAILGCLLGGCGGQLSLFESELTPEEATSGPACTVAEPYGTCPDQRLCCAGVCDTDCTRWTCNCPPEQTCVDGVCTDRTSVNQCSLQNLDGLCPGGEVCVSGQCVPLDQGNLCSPAHPQGLCPPGASCVNGVCLPTDDRPCGPEHLDGRCPAGQVCQTPGTCVPHPCSAEAPFGTCDTPETYCFNGECECIPCQPGHENGCCPADDDFCSVLGECIPDGTCLHDGDCPSADAICSITGVCINNQTCLDDADCDDFYVCNLDRFECERTYDCDSDDLCPDEEFCARAGKCLPDGQCLIDDDCRDPSRFCSVLEECIAVGTCQGDGDCPGERFCGSSQTCLDPTQCATSDDCAPGYVCSAPNCVIGSASCTTNGPASCISSPLPHGQTEYLWCCPPGETCCLQGERCSSDGLCIQDGQCTGPEDCLTGFFSCVDYACVPLQTCVEDDSCGAGRYCSQAGGCIPIGVCAADGDCPSGEVCNALFACEPETGCGDEEFDATLVPPNMLVVLDRSGSMNLCIGTDPPPPDNTRWNIARGALETVLTSHEATIRFGLSTYPLPCSLAAACGLEADNACDYDLCDNTCDWNAACAALGDSDGCNAYSPCTWQTDSCVVKDPTIATGNNYQPGSVAVAVGATTVSSIVTALAPPDHFPGGFTPTGRTLRTIAADPAAFGLADPGDPVARDNFIMLVTDGDANGDGGTYSVCDGSYTTTERVNCALDYLRLFDPPILTYVVGFVEGSRSILNCHAVHGGTSRCATPEACAAETAQDGCEALLGCAWDSGSCGGGVDEITCPTTSETCFFRADDANELSAAFLHVADQVASCTYDLDQTPDDVDRLSVYFNYRCGDVTVPGTCLLTPGCTWQDDACGGDPIRLDRDETQQDNWDYDPLDNRIVFFGSACETVKTATVTPVVIMGCCTGEGC